MDSPLALAFHGMAPSPNVETRVREQAAKLERFFGRINSCQVTIEAPHRHSRKGRLYRVRIEIGVPGKPNLVVSRHPSQHHAHEDIYVAIRDAFDAAQRRLQEHARKTSRAVKVHEAPLHGKILKLSPDRGYGFIALPDGQEIYFHRNAVVGADTKTLREGDEVRLSVAENESAKGPQATSVVPIGKHHIV